MSPSPGHLQSLSAGLPRTAGAFPARVLPSAQLTFPTLTFPTQALPTEGAAKPSRAIPAGSTLPPGLSLSQQGGANEEMKRKEQSPSWYTATLRQQAGEKRLLTRRRKLIPQALQPLHCWLVAPGSIQHTGIFSMLLEMPTWGKRREKKHLTHYALS